MQMDEDNLQINTSKSKRRIKKQVIFAVISKNCLFSQNLKCNLIIKFNRTIEVIYYH